MRGKPNRDNVIDKGCGGGTAVAGAFCAIGMLKQIGAAFPTPFRIIAARRRRTAKGIMATVAGARGCKLAFAADAMRNVLKAGRAEAGRAKVAHGLRPLPLRA